MHRAICSHAVPFGARFSWLAVVVWPGTAYGCRPATTHSACRSVNVCDSPTGTRLRALPRRAAIWVFVVARASPVLTYWALHACTGYAVAIPEEQDAGVE